MAPQIAHFDFGDEALNPGDTASAQCTMNKGDYPAELIWLLNNKSVEGVEGIYTNRIGKRISSLSIESVQAFHAGEYVCVASNVAGIASYKAYLAVNGIFMTSILYPNTSFMTKISKTYSFSIIGLFLSNIVAKYSSVLQIFQFCL